MMDKLFFNGKIRTLDGADRVTEAVGIRNGKIAFLGTNQEALAIPCEERIDLKGRLMLPGFRADRRLPSSVTDSSGA